MPFFLFVCLFVFVLFFAVFFFFFFFMCWLICTVREVLKSTALERSVINYWGVGVGTFKLALLDQALALSSENIDFFGLRGNLKPSHESLRATNKSQIKPLRKQR